jgi:hypothetical protein
MGVAHLQIYAYIYTKPIVFLLVMVMIDLLSRYVTEYVQLNESNFVREQSIAEPEKQQGKAGQGRAGSSPMA